MSKHTWREKYAPKTITIHEGCPGTAYVCSQCGAEGWLAEGILPERKKEWMLKPGCKLTAKPGKPPRKLKEEPKPKGYPLTFEDLLNALKRQGALGFKNYYRLDYTFVPDEEMIGGRRRVHIVEHSGKEVHRGSFLSCLEFCKSKRLF